jgi:hypothetical protein
METSLKMTWTKFQAFRELWGLVSARKNAIQTSIMRHFANSSGTKKLATSLFETYVLFSKICFRDYFNGLCPFG